VKSFDTNVAVRLLVDDDPVQCARAERASRRAIDEGGAFFSATVLVEVAWVLRVACKLDRAAIASALRKLITATGVTVEHEEIVRRALEAFEAGTADFSVLRLLHPRVVSGRRRVAGSDVRRKLRAGVWRVARAQSMSGESPAGEYASEAHARSKPCGGLAACHGPVGRSACDTLRAFDRPWASRGTGVARTPATCCWPSARFRPRVRISLDVDTLFAMT
jgi:predicted nucleic-acid-binding protein